MRLHANFSCFHLLFPDSSPVVKWIAWCDYIKVYNVFILLPSQENCYHIISYVFRIWDIIKHEVFDGQAEMRDTELVRVLARAAPLPFPVKISLTYFDLECVAMKSFWHSYLASTWYRWTAINFGRSSWARNFPSRFLSK